MNAPVKIGSVRYYGEMVQGSQEWHQARCGLLTASEFDRILRITGGGATTEYRATGTTPDKMTAKRAQALASIGDRQGAVRDLAFLADVSDGVIRELVKVGAIESIETTAPTVIKMAGDDRERAHLWELAAQRITNYVEPTYIGDKMLRGHEDEIRARDLYTAKYAPVTECGFVTNDRWGFTLGCSPDGLVGDDGMIECKSRDQKFQVETICKYFGQGITPDDYTLQVQGELLVAGRQWCDLISYSGGLPMVTMRIEPDPVVQDAIIDAAAKFESRINEVMAQWAEALASDVRLIPTERIVEQEMYA